MTFQFVYTTDGVKSFTFTIYLDDKMKFKTGSPFVGNIVNGKAIGQKNTDDGSYLRTPDQIVFSGCKFVFTIL